MTHTAELAPFIDSIRLTLHVLGATIWVGGQLVFAALVPVLKAKDADLPKMVAKQFNKVAWPAFILLLITGMWNMTNIPADAPASYSMVVGIKMTVVLLSGVAAMVHSRAKSTSQMAMWGAISGLTALASTYLGVLLAG